MKPKISDFVNRWRHTLGYGVHSPLAFRIIKECVHPDSRYGYYADSLIQSFAENGDVKRQLRLIIRLVNTLHLKNLWFPDCPKAQKKILAKMYPRLVLSMGPKPPQNVDFIVFFSKLNDCLIPRGLLLGKDYTILFFHSQGDLKRGPSEDGHLTLPPPTLTLLSREFTLVLSREGMQPVSYNLL